ncbi:CRISPR-associated protein Cas5 [Thermosipho sp. (in: thermotogales)]|jgi:CRISPR-associated protein Cas5 subtype I-B|uniref:CRISPR-associated protein Cas5 n=1 Tax=Thermosipho sp. (in: thermotogales) TaxID=1968895 RepID=UPI002580D961|nr:CRISPR-associated protein Cas5 [Thermosipho sp. (in: thermotogales)]MBZ4651115.1 CRISPR-associated protein Cas5 [Thermosipho sp. (in: thermotogales)]
MKAFQLKIEGNWAHFKKPETNNNPLTHDFITKTAFIGLIGAVLGKDRNEMSELFPILSDDILYGVQLLNPVKKESWGFTLRKAVNLFEKAPKNMEFLKRPSYLVSIALGDDRSEDEFNSFLTAIKNNEAKFTPILGLHNCPANLSYESEGEFSDLRNGRFTAKCFISRNHRIVNISITKHFRVGLDKIPTYQNNDFWNLPERYKEVIYPASDHEIVAEGEYYLYRSKDKEEEYWWLT